MASPSASDKFDQAIKAFDTYHKKDPNVVWEDGESYPSELLYARRMTERLDQFAPDAEESVKLAARCQHIGRWEIPRENYSMDRKGYLQWRNDEKIHHALIAENILLEIGYGAEIIEKVKMLLLKKELRSNPATQLIEDVVCQVFVEHYLSDFVDKHDDDKVVDILAKTLRKMSDRGKEALKKLEVSDRIRSLLDQAVARP